MPSDQNAPSPIESLIAGGTAGGIETFLTYPFEFAKTRVQLHGETLSSRNPFAIISNVVRSEGVPALYRGCSSLVIGSVAKDALRFTTFSRIKAQFSNDSGQQTPIQSILSGMVAGLVASTFAVTPAERLKTALIDDARSAHRFSGARDALRHIGLRGLWAGYAGTTAKQVGATGCRLGLYDVLKDWERTEGVSQSTAVAFANGAVVGTVTTLVTQPFDVVKTRAQNAMGMSTGQAVRSVVVDHGIRGFWKGTMMRLSRTVVSGGILFTSYEAVMAVL